MIAKAITIKGRVSKSGRCVVKVVGLTPGGLHSVLHSGLSSSRGVLLAMQKSAEGNRHQYFDERRAGLVLWADLLVALEHGEDYNVVSIANRK